MKTILRSAAIVISLLLYSCGDGDNNGNGGVKSEMSRGVGSLTYDMYEPLSAKPVTLHYYIPEEGSIASMRVLFAMHGADRDAGRQIENWKEIAEDKKVILLVPEFSKQYYSELEYQFGGVSGSKSSYNAVAREKWTYNLIEEIFEYVKEQTGNTSAKYDIWGHSAGGQFVHRFMFYMPDARVATAIASNSGFYTLPLTEGYKDPSSDVWYSYPFSLKYTPYTSADVEKYLAKKLIVHLGTADLATTTAQDSSLPVDAGSKAQGASRYERGHFFYDNVSELAVSSGMTFGWRLAEVEGVGHSSRGMVQTGANSAASLLYN